MNTEKKEYTAPELTVVSFKVEQGFSGSGPLEELKFWERGDANQMEEYEESATWDEATGGFWR